MQVHVPKNPTKLEIGDVAEVESLSPQAVRRQRSGGRAVRICLRGACLALLFLAIVIGAVVARFAFGTVELNFMSETIRRVIAEAAGPGHKADLSSIDLTWNDGNLRVAVHDLRLSRSDDVTVGLAPMAFLGLDLSAMLRGRIEAVSLKAYRPAISLTVGRDGVVTLGGNAKGREDREATPVLALLDPELISRVFGTQTLVQGGGSLASLDLNDMIVTLTDQRSGVTRVFERFSAAFVRTELGAFTTTLGSKGARGPWTAAIKVGLSGADGRPFQLHAETISVRDMVGEDGGAIGGVVLDLKMSGRLAPDGEMSQIDGVLGVSGDGAIEGPGWRVAIYPGNIAFSLGNDQKELLIKPSKIALGGLGGILSGSARLSASKQTAERVALDLKLEQITVDRNGGTIPEISTATMIGSFDIAARRLDIADGRTLGPLPVSEFDGSVTFIDRSPGLKLKIDARNMSAESSKRVWPRFIATDVHDWFVANVSAGELTYSRLLLDIPPGVLDGRPLLRHYIQGEWHSKGATVQLEPGLPPVTGLSSIVKATGTSVIAEGRDGRLETPMGILNIPVFSYAADDLDLVTSQARLDATLIGSAGTLLDLGERRGLAIGKTTGLDIRQMTGEGLAQIQSRGALYVGKPGAERVPSVFTVDAEFRNIAGKALIDGKDVERGSFKARSDGRTLSVEGTTLLSGVPFKISVNQEHPKAKLVFRADAELDDAARAKLGFDFGGTVTGPLALRFIREALGHDSNRRVEADLTQTRLALVEASFEKPKGVPASLSMTLRGQNPLLGLEDVVLQGKGFVVKGRVKLDEKGLPSLYELSEVRLRPEEQFSARYEIRDSGTELKIIGRVLDGRPFVQRVIGDEDPAAANTPTSKRFHASLQVERVIGHNGANINDMKLEYVREGKRISDVTLSGRLSGSARITGQVLQDQGRPYLLVTSTDGGTVLQFMDLYRNMRGGKFTMTQTLTDPQSLSESGVALIENFQIVNEATLQRLFGATPVEADGAEVRKRLGSPDNVTLDRMRIVFTRSPGMMQFSEGVLRNGTFGMTFAGRIDWRKKSVDARGTFIPIFALNNLLARIPVLGAFLGGQNEGLIGITYAVVGPLAGPTLRINPASLVAPGFLRGLFAFPDDQSNGLPQPNGSTRDSTNSIDPGVR